MPQFVVPKCFDPYLRYAISTGFSNFRFFKEATQGHRLFFLVEFKQAGLEVAFRRNMRQAGFPVEIGSAARNTRYATLLSDVAAVVDSSAFPIWDQFVSRVELSLPVKPARPPIKKIGRPVGNGRSLLIGILDDGCPFAAAQFLDTPANGSISTHVRAIWDQDQGKQPIPITDSSGVACLFGRQPAKFSYGLEFVRDSDPPGQPQRQVGLDEWIMLHRTPAGSVDEDACYHDARFHSLKAALSHGANVMDVFAGKIPTSSRIGPFPPSDHRDPPSWKPASDPASDADIVFVQFSRSCIEDATGVWLKAYVVDGINYILSYVDANTRKVVVNLSYGPTTGPHDGTAVLEAALSAFVAQYNGTQGNPRLEIVLAVGNSYLTEGHVAFKPARPANVKWTWRLPPDNSVLCFAEVWMKTAVVGAATTVTLTSPGGKVYLPTPPPAVPPSPLPEAGVDAPIVWGDNTMWRLQVEPTIVAPKVAGAEHGDWTIRVSGVGAGAEVHAYVARSDPNMGVVSGAKLSWFVDPEWELTRSAEASCNYHDGEFDRSRSLVRRRGTFNGIATGDDANVHVAGGFIVSKPRRKSSYASAGPARDGPLPLRLGPDYVLPGDESYALEGVRAGGNRSGVIFRLIGTSADAPQLAREIASPQLPPPTEIPSSLMEIEKRGGGDLPPP
jgi:hypothetical protein